MKFGSDTIYTVGLLLVQTKIENILDALRLICKRDRRAETLAT